MWPFRRKPLLDPEMSEWMFDQAQWLLTAHAHRRAFANAQLLPLSEKVFPASGPRDHRYAERMLEHVLRYAGQPDLHIELTPSSAGERFRTTGQGLSIQPKATAAGTYRAGTFKDEITYDVGLLKIPADLIAVLAHEVSHAILDMRSARPPPGDSSFEELRTDFTACFLGFGFYLAQFRADTRVPTPEAAREWKRLYMYYMNLREISFVTALFCVVRDVDPKLVLRNAPGAAEGHIKRAFADIAGEPVRVAALREAAARWKAEA